MKTIDEINARIKAGKVVVVTGTVVGAGVAPAGALAALKAMTITAMAVLS